MPVPTVRAAELSAPAPHPPAGHEACQRVSPALWYALRTRSNYERRVADALLAYGIEKYLPTYSETMHWARRMKVTVHALFPGYLFARFERFAGAAAVLSITGVIAILGNNELSSISGDEIANLRRVAESPAPIARCPYVAGAKVTVARGPFAGVSGIVRRVKGETTLTIPVEVLGRSVSVQIDAADVELHKEKKHK